MSMVEAAIYRDPVAQSSRAVFGGFVMKTVRLALLDVIAEKFFNSGAANYLTFAVFVAFVVSP
jgi:hypothetical protein